MKTLIELKVELIQQLPDWFPPSMSLHCSFKVAPADILTTSFVGGRVVTRKTGVTDRINTQLTIPFDPNVKEGSIIVVSLKE